MKYRIALLALFAVALTVVSCASSGKGYKTYKDIPVPTYKDIPVPKLTWTLPTYHEYKLPNGIDGLLVEDHEVPLIDFYLSFPAPSDPSDKVGLAEVTSWTLRNGASTNITADSLNDLIEYKAAYLGIYAGSEQVTVAGYCLVDDLPLIMGLARELIDNPLYPQDKIDLKKSTMLESIRRRNDDPGSIADREISELIYSNHPWGKSTTVASVNAITRDDLTAYHKNVFQPKGAVFGIAGDIDSAQAAALASKYFGNLMGSGAVIPPLSDKVDQSATGVYYIKKDAPQAFIAAGHLTIQYADKRRHAATIMNYILGGGGFQSRLMQKIRTEAGLAYSVYSSFDAPYPVKGSFNVTASTRPDKAGQTLTLMNDVIKDYATNGPTPEEFERARQAYVNSFVWKFESSDQILSRLVYLKWRGLPLNSPQLDLEAYQNLTLADVKTAAKELLHPENLIIVVVGDKDKMDRPLTDFGTVKEVVPE